MSSAIVSFPGGETIQQPYKSRYECGNTTYWRKMARAAGVRNVCRHCYDTGMVPVLMVDEVEMDVCIHCAHTWPDPFNEADFDPIPF